MVYVLISAVVILFIIAFTLTSVKRRRRNLLDTIENGRLHFDHRLKPGPLKTHNAIRLLELANFPEEIAREARSLSTSSAPGVSNG